MAGVASHWMVALGGIDLCVPVRLASEARSILSIKETSSERRSHFIRGLGLAFLFLVTSVPPPPRKGYL